jgi:linoleate 10R-lipoxygenase
LECVAFTTFLEWNSNPEIAGVAEKLYANIEYLELYVGLQAEEAKPLVDGAGLCPGTELYHLRILKEA